MKTFKNHNFTLMIIGQIISLFGNAILRFSISLYILDQTGSASIFATILSISILPTIFLSPVGGILADRYSRKHIMLILDFITAALIVCFSCFALQAKIPLVLIGGTMVILSIIQACYQPSVQSSVPLLVEEKQLIQANGIVVQVSALSSLLGPILAGILYSAVEFSILLWIVAFCFFCSAILECIMKIPYQKFERTSSFIKTSILDVKEGMYYITKTKPPLLRLLFILALLNLVLSSLLSVGLPVISNITLALPSQYYGCLEASLAIGSILGSIALPIFFKKYGIKDSYQFLLAASASIFIIALAISIKNHVYLSYGLVLFASLTGMIFATIFNILAQTFMQQSTPNHLLGKVSSFVTMIVMCSYPIGQSIYGYLFDSMKEQMPIVLIGACFIALIISLKTKSALKNIE